MKVFEAKTVQAVADVKCDVCGASTRTEYGGIEAGTLQATWGYCSNHDGERYEVDLCEACFFGTLSSLKRDRQTNHLFAEDDESGSSGGDEFGLVSRENF